METKWYTEVDGTPGTLSLLGLSKCCLTINLPWTRDSQPSPCSPWSSPGLSTEKIRISNLRQISDTHSFQISQLEHFMIKTEPELESFLHQLLCVAQGHESPLGCSTQSVGTTALMWMNWAVLSPSGWKPCGLLDMCYHLSYLQFDSGFQDIFFLFSEQCSVLRSGLPLLGGHHFPSPGKCDIMAGLYLDPLTMLCSGHVDIEVSLQVLLFSPFCINDFCFVFCDHSIGHK